ncbi:MAG: dienelactone hydrolase family protein [Sandarakinorhabdus sp.]|nr:dienelactone hydrolase family protein [Sandarakinorhabdus sp.]
MGQQRIVITTGDGDCPVEVLAPDGAGPWPAVVLFMDAGGIRPALIAMAARLAEAGYMVLVPDLFYRFGPYAPMVPKELFKGDFRAVIGPMMATTSNQKAAADLVPLIDWLAVHPDVRGVRIGGVGYCMGGAMALTAAARYPGHVVAAASFHGGHLADDSPTSPHLLARDIRAEVYVAGADADASYPLQMAARLQGALADAGVRNKCEIYPGALHGWTMPDFPVYDHDAAERAWTELLALLARNLSPSQ